MADAPGTTDDPVEGHPLPDDAVLELLRGWLPHQRWFPAKGTSGGIERVAVIGLADPLGEAEVRLELLRLPGGGLLHVPVTLRTDDGTPRPGTLGVVPGVPGATGASGVAAGTTGPTGPATVVVDGCHDGAFLRAWFAAATRDTASGMPTEVDLTGMKVAGGEQSNTSVFLPAASPPAILKVFRGISPGANPDVDVPLALSHAGWGGVPRPLAWLTGSWPAAEGTERQVGHLGVLSELVVGAQDGFELACRMAGEGADFGDLAEDLGRTTAQMHHALRTALPVAPAEDSGADGPHVRAAEGVLATLRDRAAAAVAAAPVLAERAPAIDRVLAEVEHVRPLPPLQRVHGDFHLGQVLRSDRGWAVLDFEGEPQAPTAERTRPDLALRDLAGMLRSIDYAAAVGGSTSPGWSAEARRRLVEGYHREDEGPGGAGSATDVLLRALELDKALYEVVYESRNRPTWLPIPLAAVDRLLTDQH